MGWVHQAPLLDLVAAWLPEGAAAMVLGDRFYGTAEAIVACAAGMSLSEILCGGRTVTPEGWRTV
jgi:hypothetical protein